MPENTSGTEGLVRYRVSILVEMPDGEDEIAFNAYGPVLPRTGERLEIDGVPGEALSVLITGVDHQWYLSGGGVDKPAVTVAGEIADSYGHELAQRLVNDPGALKAWVSNFPYLEPVDFARAL
ncbi:hypothetical protein [Nocardia jejuensis]|uniref:hypothetical protein n=1 Tax=Nocardia jejuensis TaxID=328049 RepID=UPI00082D5531|nr:hypothetical protein [Nocardia jejuensis]